MGTYILAHIFAIFEKYSLLCSIFGFIFFNTLFFWSFRCNLVELRGGAETFRIPTAPMHSWTSRYQQPHQRDTVPRGEPALTPPNPPGPWFTLGFTLGDLDRCI